MLAQLLLDVLAERDRTFCLLTHLRVVAAKCNKLFADWAAAVRLSLALFRVRDDTLHLVTRRRAAVCIPALTSMDQTLDASCDGILTVRNRI